MFTIFAWGVVVFLGGIAILFLYARTLPDHFHITRTINIGAPAGAIFPMIADLREFNRWNPFIKGDQRIEIRYLGPPNGVGARHEWTSSGRAGKGSLEIVGVSPSARITMLLHMIRPMEAENTITFTLQELGGNTAVTWAMTGENRCMGKVMSLICSMDRMVGGEFEKGLGDLKRLVEERQPSAGVGASSPG